MTGDPMEPHAPPDFANLIDKVIAREMRTNLSTFLQRYRVVEYGFSRVLNLEEIALILRVIDDFMLDDRALNVGFTEFDALHQRLALHANGGEGASAEEETAMRNACFDALACIKALEARLGAALSRIQIPRGAAPSSTVANDR